MRGGVIDDLTDFLGFSGPATVSQRWPEL